MLKNLNYEQNYIVTVSITTLPKSTLDFLHLLILAIIMPTIETLIQQAFFVPLKRIGEFYHHFR